MTHYNSAKNIQISDLQLDKSKSAIKNQIEVSIRFLSNMIGTTNGHVASFCNAFANHSSANIKLA